MLAPFAEIVAERRARGAAAGAFTCYDLEAAHGALAAAAARDAPVVLLVSVQAFRAPGGFGLLAALRAVAERSRAPACSSTTCATSG